MEDFQNLHTINCQAQWRFNIAAVVYTASGGGHLFYIVFTINATK